MSKATSKELYAGTEDSSVYWNVQPYGVAFGKDFATYEDSLKSQLAVMLGGDANYKSSSYQSRLATAQQAIAQDKSASGSAPMDKSGQEYSYHSPSVSDASIGGNDVINPHAAFCLDDDIVHELFTRKGQSWGMGRVYSEIYDSKQQILYLTMGVPKYRNLTTWLKNAANKELSELNDNGKASSWPNLGELFTSGLKLAFELPWLPLIWAHKFISGIKQTPVTEYFRFQDSMPLYYRYVNTLMSEIAVGMGIYGNGTSSTSGTSTDGGSKTDGTTGNGANMTPEQSRLYESNLPAIMKDGPDILKIMCRRSERMGSGTTTLSTDQFLQQAANPKEPTTPYQAGTLDNFWTGIQTGALEGANFIGFRIDRSESASESFSNSTQESNLAQQLNQEVQANRDRNLGEKAGEGLMAWLMQKKAQGQALMGALQSKDLGKTIAYVAAGNGYFDLPKQWAGASGMGRSLTFNMKLRAKTGGDNVSIYQSIMIPLCMLLAAALPRAAGDSTYTSPFIVRAFCKGMFAVPAGIISSLSITRGASEFGWSLNRLPTVVDVSFTIEDLSPMLFLSMAGSGGPLSPFVQAFSNNTKMHEYLNTLTGIGCKERYFRLNQMKRRLTAAALITKNTYGSATWYGFNIGDSSLVRTVMALTPWHRVKNN